MAAAEICEEEHSPFSLAHCGYDVAEINLYIERKK